MTFERIINCISQPRNINDLYFYEKNLMITVFNINNIAQMDIKFMK